MQSVVQNIAQSDTLYLTSAQVELIRQRRDGKCISGAEMLRKTFEHMESFITERKSDTGDFLQLTPAQMDLVVKRSKEPGVSKEEMLKRTFQKIGLRK
jgi:hypothetical protein